jgi:hypothetical protein
MPSFYHVDKARVGPSRFPGFYQQTLSGRVEQRFGRHPSEMARDWVVRPLLAVGRAVVSRLIMRPLRPIARFLWEHTRALGYLAVGAVVAAALYGLVSYGLPLGAEFFHSVVSVLGSIGNWLSAYVPDWRSWLSSAPPTAPPAALSPGTVPPLSTAPTVVPPLSPSGQTPSAGPAVTTGTIIAAVGVFAMIGVGLFLLFQWMRRRSGGGTPPSSIAPGIQEAAEASASITLRRHYTILLIGVVLAVTVRYFGGEALQSVFSGYGISRDSWIGSVALGALARTKR